MLNFWTKEYAPNSFSEKSLWGSGTQKEKNPQIHSFSQILCHCICRFSWILMYYFSLLTSALYLVLLDIISFTPLFTFHQRYTFCAKHHVLWFITSFESIFMCTLLPQNEIKIEIRINRKRYSSQLSLCFCLCLCLCLSLSLIYDTNESLYRLINSLFFYMQWVFSIQRVLVSGTLWTPKWMDAQVLYKMTQHLHISYAFPLICLKSSLGYLRHLRQCKCYVNSCLSMVHSCFAFWNLLEYFYQYFQSADIKLLDKDVWLYR